MNFNNVNSKDGLIQNCEINLFGDAGFTQISGNANRLAIFTNYLNEGLSRYATIALMSDDNWEWEDRNQTDLPIGTTTLTNNQQDYGLSTEHSIITAVELKDTAGKWNTLKELDSKYFVENNISISQHEITPGIPTQYIKIANSILLFPKPNFTQAASLKVHFKRAPSYYTSADTTKEQGFTDLHSAYLSDYATWKYATNRTMPMADRLRAEISIWEEMRIPEFYSKRSDEHSKRLIPVVSDSR